MRAGVHPLAWAFVAAAGLVCFAFLPAAFWSWPRLLLFVLVLGGTAWLERAPARESNVFGRGRETSKA